MEVVPNEILETILCRAFPFDYAVLQVCFRWFSLWDARIKDARQSYIKSGGKEKTYRLINRSATEQAVWASNQECYTLEYMDWALHTSPLLHRGKRKDKAKLFKHFMPVAQYAALRGDLVTLEWLLENGAVPDEETFACAGAGGWTPIIQYLYKTAERRTKAQMERSDKLLNGLTTKKKKKSCGNNTAFSGENREEQVDYLRWDQMTCALAASNGHLHVLRFARERGCPWDSETAERAAAKGFVDILEYLHQHRCPRDARAAVAAVKNGHMGTLVWLHEHLWPFSCAVGEAAAEHGRLEAIKWLKAVGIIGAGYSLQRVLVFAAWCNRKNIISWLLETTDDTTGTSEDDTKAKIALSVTQTGNVAMLAWLFDEMAVPFDSPRLVETSLRALLAAKEGKQTRVAVVHRQFPPPPPPVPVCLETLECLLKRNAVVSSKAWELALRTNNVKLLSLLSYYAKPSEEEIRNAVEEAIARGPKPPKGPQKKG